MTTRFAVTGSASNRVYQVLDSRTDAENFVAARRIELFTQVVEIGPDAVFATVRSETLRSDIVVLLDAANDDRDAERVH